jgi:hypothetical protein
MRLHRKSGLPGTPKKKASRNLPLHMAFQELNVHESVVSQPASSFGRLQKIVPISLPPPSVCNADRPPKTPSKIPLVTERFVTPIPVRKLHVPGQKSSPKKGGICAVSPSKTRFLSKDSNLTEAAWEDSGVGDRIARFEAGFEQMKAQMEGTTFERNNMKELIEMMKTRSELTTPLSSR